MSSPSTGSELRELCTAEQARIRAAFEAGGDGRACAQGRAALVDSLAHHLWREFLEERHSRLALVALGGFGRGTLFPASDIDLLFLCSDAAEEDAAKPAIRAFCQELWDLRLRVSPTTRSLGECARFDHANVEFTIALLDCRFLAGNRELFDSLHNDVLPALVLRERQPLVQRLAEVTLTRHHKYGDTIFHLEPNVKDGPGGLRDYNVACWLALIASLEKRRGWPERRDHPELAPALDAIFATRCFLHYRSNRDDNALTWEAQDAAAAAGVGFVPAMAVETNDWMRRYFRHARAISRLTAQLLDDIPPARSSLFQQYQQWRSRLSTADFSVVAGRVYLQEPAAVGDPDVLMRLFIFMARHGFKLSADTERRIARVLPHIAVPQDANLWPYLRDILRHPHAALALRAMHAAVVLTLAIPELHAIDALVIRDFYHRYTVDEHTFVAISNLHALAAAATPIDARFAAMLSEVEQPEFLYLALLLHDVGKGAPPGLPHVQAGLPMIEPVLNRLGLADEEKELVRFLIRSHLEMSALLRRDIFDPEISRALAECTGTPERACMLALLTYADIKAVNPEALTVWKAEDLWQLYASAVNHMDRCVDQERLDASERNWSDAAARQLPSEKLAGFLDGVPRRYLLTHSAQEIATHSEMASRLARTGAEVMLGRRRGLHELTVVTNDRPALFADIAGVLAAWGMEIVKASAFSNSAGTVIDTFLFTDPYRTLELNPGERERLQTSALRVLLGEATLEEVMRGRLRPRPRRLAEDRETRLLFTNDCSAHRTVLELVTADRPGLLHRVASVLSRHACNLEIALIDTEGHVAIDVFYLTIGGNKLGIEQQNEIADALREELSAG